MIIGGDILLKGCRFIVNRANVIHDQGHQQWGGPHSLGIQGTSHFRASHGAECQVFLRLADLHVLWV